MRNYDENRRPSTILRDEWVLDVYAQVCNEIGEIAPYVCRKEIYRRVAERVFLTPKTIERIVNHVRGIEPL